MSKTLADYISIVQNEVDTTSTSDREVIEDGVKRKYQEVLLQAHKYLVASTIEEINTVSGTASYNTSTGFTEVKKVYYKKPGGTNFFELTPITERDYLEFYINEDNSSPTRYYIKGETIYPSPIPNEAGTLKVVYTPVPSELVDETDVSIIPDRYTNVIKYGASKDFLAFEKDPATDAYERYYINALADMMAELKTSEESIRPRFRGRERYNLTNNYYLR